MQERVSVSLETPADPLGLVRLGSDRPIVGVDVGGTDAKVLLGSSAGVVAEWSEPTRLGSGEALVDQLAEIVARAGRQGDAPAAVGIHVPGIVDERAGTIVRADNLAITDLDLVPRLEQRLGLPVAFGNDARGAGYAEFQAGAAQDARTAVVIAIGTGIGAAVKVDGRVYDADGYGMEIGHMRMTPAWGSQGRACACGGTDCLERFFSGPAIVRSYRAAGGDAADAATVFRLADDGDARAADVIQRSIDVLALAIAQLASSLAPEVVVLAGGLSRAGARLFDPLAEGIEDLLTFQRRPQLRRAWFGGHAGAVASLLRADERVRATASAHAPSSRAG